MVGTVFVSVSLCCDFLGKLVHSQFVPFAAEKGFSACLTHYLPIGGSITGDMLHHWHYSSNPQLLFSLNILYPCRLCMPCNCVNAGVLLVIILLQVYVSPKIRTRVPGDAFN